MSFLLRTARFAPSISTRAFSTSRVMSIKVDSNFLSQITAAEKTITNQDEPAKGGPTAMAQKHVGQELNSQIVSDITLGERTITGRDGPVQNGPTSVAQSILTGSGSTSNAISTSTSNNNSNSNNTSNAQHNGRLDSNTISKITEKEKEITGADGPTPGGPTAQAQKHANETITSEALHDITEGEKKITGGERVKGGPTSAAQSELGKSRS
jgi:hypothetical protein